LPIGMSNPVARLQAVRDGMNQLKNSRQALVSYGLLSLLGVGPGMLQRPVLELMSRKATAVATNVPGPPTPLFFCGVAISEMMFWVPQTGSIGMGVSILSYAGSVYFGLIVDSKLVPNPNEISQRFAPELEQLLLIALLHQGEQTITPASAEQLLIDAPEVRKRKARPKMSAGA